jgi:hypothetical protein
MTDKIQVGDTVAIRGDKRRVGISYGNDSKCAYTDDQLVDGKYLKHTGTGEIWTGKVTKICDDEFGGMALVGGGWRGIEMYEKMPV